MWAALVALCVLTPSPRAVAAKPPPPDLTCTACLVVDETGKVLFARNAQTPLPNASTTKMMTALVVSQRAQLAEETTVSGSAAAIPGGKLGLIAGERWSIEELLLALLLSSSNDAAVALAEHVAGDESSFVALMNREAARLGLAASSYATSHGLDAAGHASSAEDLATLGAVLLEDPLLADIVGTPEATIESSERVAEVENTNLLLESYNGAIGVKTGFTALAGNVLVAAAERDGRRVIAVAMHSEDAFVDAARLLDHGFAALDQTVLLKRASTHGAVVLDGVGATAVAAEATVRGSALRETLSFNFEMTPDLSLPLAAGDEVGTIEVLDETGARVASVPATATQGLAEQQPDWRRDALTALLGFAGDLLGE